MNIHKRSILVPWQNSQRFPRAFSACPLSRSGHNRWSKIRHDKAKTDASLNKQRAAFAYEIALASKLHGPDPQFNPSLAGIIATAKKQGVPKASIESAVLRGQGISSSGAPLISLTLEAIVPPSVGVIIECRTDNKLRTLSELKLLIKDHGGNVASTSHLFEKTGKVVLENTTNLSIETIFDEVIETGATHVEVEDDGNISMYCEPEQTAAAAREVSQRLQAKVLSSDIVWMPNSETAVDISSESETLQNFLDQLHENSSVQEVYVNAK